MAQALYATPFSSSLPFWLLRKSLINAARARLARVLSKKSSIKCSTCKTSACLIKKNKLTHLQFYKGNPFTFFGKKKSTLKFCLKFTGKSLYKIFLKKNPCKIDSLFRKVVNFTKEIPLNFFSEKNYPQISPNFSRKIDKLDTIFSKTLSKRVFLKILENFSNLSKPLLP